MDKTYVKEILEKVSEQDLSVEEAYELLKDLPYEDIGYANIDEHRGLRTGQAEVIFGQGKTPEQIAGIAFHMAEHNDRVLVTRTTPEAYEVVARALPEAVYHEVPKIITIGDIRETEETEAYIAVVTAGTSDIPVAEETALTAEFLGHRVERVFDVGVAGIHRLFDKMDRIRGAAVVIVIAGMEGALASVIGGLVETPVIAVPTSVGYGASFDGLAALLSMLNSCANGIGVVNIDNGYGAACLASKICRENA
ncbi:MAG: nickel pincer cofactor biosynthesis protein LarB [Lachnospiraceae bacterium]|nr:nickel pincer cofactor biosynthesis protein LarB [Lachnospiraceae bacterium]